MTSMRDLLCRAIDQGDDMAIAALADHLEEVGDLRARGLRICLGKGRLLRYVPSRVRNRCAWQIGCGHQHSINGLLPAALRRVAPESWGHYGDWFLFETRSAAYLALAAALAEQAS